MICLSFDTDHVDEVRMGEFLGTVPIPGQATFFCTQRYGCLGEPHEICPHPRLEPGTRWEAELTAKRAEFPDAVGWRSHSCTYSHLLAQRVATGGYLYASTQYQPVPPVRPFREAWGLWHMPIYYMDNLDFSPARFWRGDHVPFDPAIVDSALADDGIYVFDFHPVHLMLNSASADVYLERRGAFRAGDPVHALRCEARGARTFYDELCARMDTAGERSVTMQDALAGWEGREPARAAG